MTKVGGLVVFLVTIFMLAPIIPIIQADTVISSESVELLSAGDFDDPNQWEITSTSGFSNNPADYTVWFAIIFDRFYNHLKENT